MNVYRSNKNIYAQLIDDRAGTTLVSASTQDKELTLDSTANVEAASKVGELIATRAKDKGIKSVVFDRGGFLYHGRLKAVAEGVREAGQEFYLKGRKQLSDNCRRKIRLRRRCVK